MSTDNSWWWEYECVILFFVYLFLSFLQKYFKILNIQKFNNHRLFKKNEHAFSSGPQINIFCSTLITYLFNIEEVVECLSSLLS